MPRPSAASAAIALTGSAKIQQTMMKMAQLEQLIQSLVKDLPGLANLADPFITQMRDMGAQALANQTQGGIGSAADASVPVPTAGMAGGPGAAAAGPPPPPPM